MKFTSKRLVSMLICLAMALAILPIAATAVGDSDVALYDVASSEVITVEEGTVSLMSNPDPMLGIPAQSHVIDWTAPEDGKLTVNMAASEPGWAFVFTFADGSTTLRITGNNDRSETYDVFAGQTYSVEMWCYDKASWGEGNGDVTYKLTFEACDLGSGTVVEEFLYSDIALVVGVNELTMMENAENTLFDFTPSETGAYTFTVPFGYQIGNWGLFGTKPTEEMTFTFTWECSSVGQGIMVGVAGSEPVTMTIEKTGEAYIPETIVYEDYVNVHTPNSANRPVLGYGQSYQNVDITVAQTVVMGEDGFYHLNSATGPVIYADLINDAIDLTAAYAGYGANAMKGQIRDKDGNLVAAYNFLNSMKAYKDAMDRNGRYPLTEDLALFLQAYGGAQGWYESDKTSFEAIKADHCADSAWLVACCYMASEEEPVDPPVNPSIPSDPTTEPSIEVTEPSTEVTEPSTEVTEPSTEVTEPSIEVTEPSTEATEPSTEVTEPSTEVTEPSTEVTEPSTEVTEPSTEVTEPSTEVTEPSTEVTEPSTEVTEPSTEVTEPSTEVTEPSTEVTEPSTEVTEPSTEVTEPSTEVTEPSTEVTEPSIEVTEPSTEVTEPSTEVTEPSTEVTEPSTEVTEPSTEATEPSTEVTEPSTEATEPSTEITEPSVEDATDPSTEPSDLSDYRVVGDAEWLGSWDPNNESGRMMEISEGVYQITFKNVPVGTYEFKITKGGTWDENWGDGGANGGNIKLNVDVAGDVVITFKGDDSSIAVETPDEEIPKTSDATITALAAALLLAGSAVFFVKKKEN